MRTGNEISMPRDAGLGGRIKAARTHKGLSREAVASLCGMSEIWLRQLERGTRGTSWRNLAKLAEVLGITDMAELIGETMPTAVFTRPDHPATVDIRAALYAAPFADPEEGVPTLDDIQKRVRQAWLIRAASSRDRTDLAPILPDLMKDCHVLARQAGGAAERREAYRLLTEIYHLVQLFSCYQSSTELVWLAADRAIIAAQESEDPAVISTAAWFVCYLHRDFGSPDQAHQVIEDALRWLNRAEDSPRIRRRTSLAHLAQAWTFGRELKPAQAWRAWDLAVEADRNAEPEPPFPLFGSTISDVALTLDIELGQTRSALRRAEQVDPNLVSALPRRARLAIEAARGYNARKEYVGAVHLLRRAVTTSPEATIFSLHARSMAHELAINAGPMLRRDAVELAQLLGVAA